MTIRRPWGASRDAGSRMSASGSRRCRSTSAIPCAGCASIRWRPIAALLDRGGRIGQGMDFDIEIIVRLHRAGTPVVNHPVSVDLSARQPVEFQDVARQLAHHEDAYAADARHACFAAGCPVAAVAPRRHGDALGGPRRARNLLGIAGERLGLSPAGPSRLHGDAGARRALFLPHGRRATPCLARLPRRRLRRQRPVAAPRLVGRLSAFPVLRPPCARQFRRLDGPDAGRRRACRWRLPRSRRPKRSRAARCSSSRTTAMSTSRAPCSTPGLAGASSSSRTRGMRRTTIASCASSIRKPPSTCCRSPRWGRTPPSRCSSGSTAATGCSLPAIARRSAEAGGPASRRFSARTPNSPRGPI